MKKTIFFVFVAILYCSALASAELKDRGGGLIYDTVLNVTWLQDANYARTTGYDADGLMTWEDATTWAANLEYYDSAREVTWTDWRLPRTLPVNGSNYDYALSYNGSTDVGFNLSAPDSVYPGSTSSELAYMYYTNLGNIGQYDISGVSQPGSGPVHVSPFVNLQDYPYWSSTENASNTSYAWNFDINRGFQDDGTLKATLYYAWAVRDGDVGPAPEVGGNINSGSSDCFIATAAFGSSIESHVMVLRAFRDQVLLGNPVGRSFVSFYYKVSPPIANFISQYEALKMLVRWSLLPVVGLSWIALNIGPIFTLGIILVLTALLWKVVSRTYTRECHKG